MTVSGVEERASGEAIEGVWKWGLRWSREYWRVFMCGEVVEDMVVVVSIAVVK